MRNPWEEIELSDYENHMKLNSVMQLQFLNEMMKNQFNVYPIKSVMILGVAGGNGLEHIDASKICRVYGVDINSKYLHECEVRYKNLSGVLECVCADLTDDNTVLPYADMLIADLLIEYIGYDCFEHIVAKIKPEYVSCIIQINTDDGFVSDSPYNYVFNNLNEVHHQIEEKYLAKLMIKTGYRLIAEKEQELPNSKKLVQLDFKL